MVVKLSAFAGETHGKLSMLYVLPKFHIQIKFALMTFHCYVSIVKTSDCSAYNFRYRNVLQVVQVRTTKYGK